MSTTYISAEHVPAALRLLSHTGVIHVRSRHTRHWPRTGTLACNDGRELPIAPLTLAHGYLCRRCLVLYRTETTA